MGRGARRHSLPRCGGPGCYDGRLFARRRPLHRCLGPSRGSSCACHCGGADHAGARAWVVGAAFRAPRVYLAAVDCAC
eukprot:6778294-Prymnesium_polylepis.1